MMRGTFANIRIRNEMAPGTEGGVTRHMPDGEVMPIYDAAMRYEAEGVPLVIVGGKEYGTGSSPDWAAKGPRRSEARRVGKEGVRPCRSRWSTDQSKKKPKITTMKLTDITEQLLTQ